MEIDSVPLLNPKLLIVYFKQDIKNVYFNRAEFWQKMLIKTDLLWVKLKNINDIMISKTRRNLWNDCSKKKSDLEIEKVNMFYR